MSYQVLARKWRPAKFEQMVGQSHVLLALTNALSQQRLHHAYLFTGTRGVGKTSLARLFAKGLNCETGVTANPCGTCSSCVEIAQGRFVDLIEVDAASRTKVDDTRELLDNVQYKPARGRFKVYLIDEVHMLSRSSFNALLKTLEEPPEHVKFLLATTDPQKLPVTVLSRCLQFNLKSLSQDEISQQLDFVLGQEQLPFESQALTLLAKAANGSMRDALSLTDQAIAFGSGQVMLTQVQTMLGSIDERQVIGLLKSLCDADIAHLMQTTAQVLSFGADADEVLRSLLELLHQITLSQFAPAAAQHSLYSEQILAFAKQLKPEQVQLYYQILLTGRKELAFAPDPKSGLEMALLRAVAFVPEKTVNRWVVDDAAKLELPSGTSMPVSKHSEPNLDIQSMSSSSADAIEPVVEQVVTASQTLAPMLDNHSANTNVDPELSGDASSDEDDKEDASLSALDAEQKVLLSQATGMGFDESANVDANHVAAEPSANNEANATDEYADYMHYGFDEPLPETHADAYVADEGDSTADNEFAQGSRLDSNSNTDTEAESAALVPVVDDILDAVLASRDALMADVSAINLANNTEPNAGSIKAGAAKKPLAVPQTNRTVDESNIAQENLQSCSETHVAAGLNAATEARLSHSHTIADKRPDTDRPPWVAASDGSSPFDPLGENKDIQLQTAIIEASMESPEHHTALVSAALANQDNRVELAMSEVELPEKSAATEILTEHQISGHGMDLHWYKMMAEVKIGGRIRQLAVNSVCQGLTSPLRLLLKPDQKHLGAEVAVNQLEAALSEYLQQDISIAVSVGYDEQRETPLELRKRFHQELLQQAKQRLMSNNKVQWMLSQLGAELQEDSLVYPPEKLQQVGQQITFQQQDAAIMQKLASIA
ncbi:DNA polymerase III subunit gamma/tau [Shewanella sp. SR44-3]|uniref:DNA polymerase III subunit gamma/tau n=1 Tax=Shewanella sp. SR44-3 TaxID=2760936 RepID=UPI0015FB63F6|nr:DNA polymerase III subunit gamma/tau [Shewanella sp. SR44-3]MBB1271031.1 DNA polymerase III subunit gamma/tau [Shewanella sp. SR44-3]